VTNRKDPVSASPPTQKRADLVFEGGGVKGIGLAGAYSALWEDGYQAQRVAGTSAGAITAALVAAGYTGPELEDIVLHQMDFTKFEDPHAFGLPGEIVELVRTRGLHSGDYFLSWIAERLSDRGLTTFGDLRTADDTGVKAREYRLQLIASDLSARSMLVLPRDAARIGVDPDHLEIAKAVRMSMSIPVFFAPTLCTDADHRQHTIVDGGLLSNYPLWLFDCPPGQVPEYPTFGMLLVASNQSAPLLPDPTPAEQLGPVTSPVEFGRALVDTMMEAHDRLYVEQADYARTIPIPTQGVKTTEFRIPAAQARDLFDSGHAAATEFLASWDFPRYITRFRTGTPPSRRAQILEPPALSPPPTT
jgi:NTE family protein